MKTLLLHPKKLPLLYLMGLLMAIGCVEERGKTPSQIYTEQTAQLLNDILNEEGYCKCLEMPSNRSFIEANVMDMPFYDMRGVIAKRMELPHVSQVDSLVGHWEALMLTKDQLRHDVQLFPDGSFVNDLALYGRQKADSLWMMRCPEFLCSFSKPLFNQDFTMAVIDVGYMGGCLYSGPGICRKIEGVWQYD